MHTVGLQLYGYSFKKKFLQKKIVGVKMGIHQCLIFVFYFSYPSNNFNLNSSFFTLSVTQIVY